MKLIWTLLAPRHQMKFIRRAITSKQNICNIKIYWCNTERYVNNLPKSFDYGIVNFLPEHEHYVKHAKTIVATLI
jgi:hypothetical protein